MEKEEFITTETMLCEVINDLIGPYDIRGIRQWVRKFKIYIYCGSLGHSNPFYSCKLQEKLELPNGIKYIHELMYLYLAKQNFLKLTYPEKDANHSMVDYLYNSATEDIYEWHIPTTFVPFVTAYILTAKDKKIFPPTAFFAKMDTYFNDICSRYRHKLSLTDVNNLNDAYKQWKKKYLGCDYFILLDDMYEEFTDTGNQFQYQTFSEVITPLTHAMLTNAWTNNMTLSNYTEKLKIFKSMLEEKTGTDRNNIYLLYPYTMQITTDTQISLINESYANIVQVINSASSYIVSNLEMHHKQDSLYELAINNCDSFAENMEKYKNKINDRSTHEPENLRSNINHFLNSSMNSEAISSGNIIVDNSAIEDIVKQYESLLKHYSSDVNQEFDTFLKLTKYSSSDNPAKYKSVKIHSSYMNNLQVNLNLLHRNFEEKCKNLNISFLTVKKYGYLREINIYDFIYT